MTTRVKAITNVPGWLARLQSADKITNAAQAYAAVPLVYRAIQLRADALSSVPVRVYQGNSEREIGWPFLCDPVEFLWKTEAALLARGASFAEVARNSVRVRDLVWINPYTVDVDYDAGEFTFKQRGNKAGVWVNRPGEMPEMFYMREFSLSDDVSPGVSAASVSMTATQLLRYMDRFAAYFFEQGAMPVTLLGIDTNDDDEVKRIEGIFRRMITNIRNAFRVIGVKSKSVVPSTLTPPMKDLVIPELSAEARREVSIAFGIPYSLLDEPANYAVAESHKQTFWQNTVRPRGMKLEGQLNREIFAPLGLRVELAFDELDVFQVSEAARAASLGQLTTAGMDILTACEILGYDLTPEQIARLLANQVIAVQPEPAPERENLQGAQAEQDGEPMGGGDAAMMADLRRWERKAAKRAKEGKAAACVFESAVIPGVLRAAVAGALEEARGLADVRRTFSAANKALEVYP